MKKTNKLITISNIASFVIIVALAVMQFMPYWYTVNGVHMTPAEYEEYVASEPYVYTGEKIVVEKPEEEPEVTTEATTEEATEATTEEATEAATEEATEAATEAATEPAEKKTDEGYYVLKCYACDTEQNVYPSSVKFNGVKNLAHTGEKCVACKTESGFNVIGIVDGDSIAPWEDVIERSSISQRVWFIIEGAPVLMNHVWTLLIGAVCFYFCILRTNKTISFIPVGAVALLNTLDYLKPEAMTGSNWIVHMILSVLLFVPAIVLFVFWIIDVVRWFVVKER